MADQDRHHRRVGGICGESVWHHHQAAGKTHVRGHLVLHRHGRHGRRAAHHQLDGRCRAGWFKSYSMYAGVQDALVQWWYGHNAVAFFLTTPYLGLMYYFLPKAANRPIFSYRLSIIHFWALIFIYIWAGPHHLLYTALPDWAQSLGMVFSLMLIAPSLGRHVERPAHVARRVGQSAAGSGAEIHGCRHHGLRHGARWKGRCCPSRR